MQIENQSRSKDRESRSRRNLSSIDVGFRARPRIGSIKFLSSPTPHFGLSALETCWVADLESFLFFRTYRPSNEWCPSTCRIVFLLKNCSNTVVDTSVVTGNELSSPESEAIRLVCKLIEKVLRNPSMQCTRWHFDYPTANDISSPRHF